MMRRRLYGALLFLAVFFFLDRFLYEVIMAGFQRTTTGEAGGIINKALQKRVDLLILGSSRAVHHYDPRVLHSVLYLSAYNAGCNSQEIHYMKGLTDLVLKRYTPRITIINIDAGSVQDALADLRKATTLASFMSESEVIREMIYSISPLERFKYASLSYRFNNKPFAIIKNLFAEDRSISGFKAMEGVLKPEESLENVLTSPVADTYMMELLRTVIRQLKNSGTHVVLAHSPRWTKEGTLSPYRKPILLEIRQLAKDEQVSFIAVTLENTSEFQNSKFFMDTAHLNSEGAQLFSEIIAWKIGSLIKNEFKPVYDEF